MSPSVDANVETQILELPVAESRKVESYKKKIPDVLKRIAMCESNGRHYDENGEAIHGKNPHDVGKYQINMLYWGGEAKKLGYDLTTEDGNEAMALEIYRRHNTQPWMWSKPCWNKET